MPSYAPPTDPGDVILLSHASHQKGTWLVLYEPLPGVRAVYAAARSFRRANFLASTLTGTPNVYWGDGTQFWLATP